MATSPTPTRVHYYLRKHALAVQKSVFMLQIDPKGLAEIEAELRARVKALDDDLRLYAIPGPAALWTAGQQGVRMSGLYGDDTPGQGNGGRLRHWFKGLFGQEAA